MYVCMWIVAPVDLCMVEIIVPLSAYEWICV